MDLDMMKTFYKPKPHLSKEGICKQLEITFIIIKLVIKTIFIIILIVNISNYKIISL